MSVEPVVLRPYGIWPKLDFVVPLGALGFAAYQALETIYWSGFVIFMSPVVIYGVVHLWSLIRRRAKLTPVRLEYCNGYWWRGIDRKDVKGYRTRSSRAGIWYHLVPKDPEAKPCSIPEWLFQHRDAKFWFDGLTDLTPIEKAEAKAGLEADPALGPDQTARLRRIAKLKVFTVVVSVIATALLFAGILTNWCDRWVLGGLVAMVPLGLLLDGVYPGQFRFLFENEGRDARPTLVALYGISGFLAPAGTWGALHIQAGMALDKVAFVVGLALTAYVLWCAPLLRKQFGWAAAMAIIMIGYVAFALSYLNIVLDRSPQVAFPTVIQNLDTRHTYVDIAPWAGEIWSASVAVTRSQYGRLHAGQPVCVFVGKGAFGFAWYEIGDCDSSRAHDRF